MHVEVSVALNFVISYLYTKLPRRRVDMFGEELEKGLKKKFEGHWYPDKPAKGSGFRCIRVSGENGDPVIETAALNAGLDIEEIREYLPKDLTVWIDPLEVSYRIGEKGVVKVLYSNREEKDSVDAFDREVQAVSKGFNPDAQCFKPIDSLSSSLSNLSLSPSSPTSPAHFGSVTPVGGSQAANSTNLSNFISRANHPPPMFTTASFAQTKFGSTKLKSQAKRPTRLSPTELTTYAKPRPFVNGPPINQPPPGSLPSPFGLPRSRNVSPRDLSPRDMMDQPHPMYMPQQHPQQYSPSSGSLPSPIGNSIADLYNLYQTGMAFNDVVPTGRGGHNMPPSMNNMHNIPSPEGNKAFLEGLASLPPYASLQHLLVAN